MRPKSHLGALFLGVLLFSTPSVAARQEPPSNSDESDSTPEASRTEGVGPLLAAAQVQSEGDAARPFPLRFESRRQWWTVKKLEKLEGIHPPKKHFLERLLLWGEEKFTEVDQLGTRPGGGFYPDVGTVTSGSGLAAGPGYRRFRINSWPLDFQASAAYSIRGYEKYQVRFGKFQQKSSRVELVPFDAKATSQFNAKREREKGLSLFADLAYHHFPEQDFYGIGPASVGTDRTDYLMRGASYEGVLQYQFTRWLGAAVRGGLLDFAVAAGRDQNLADTPLVFSDPQAPGLDLQPQFLHLGTAFLIDYRDHPGIPHSGGMVGFTVSRFDDRGGQAFRFNRYQFDARHYFPLGSVQRVLALRALVSSDDAASGARVPFYLMQSLGGGSSLRGFHSFRFRDRNLLYLSTEYRWEAFPSLEFALFYDTGRVAPRFSDLSFEGLEKTYGGGVRLKSSQTVMVRLDAGWSREGPRVYLSLGPSF